MGLVGTSNPRLGGYLQIGQPITPIVSGAGLPANYAGAGMGNPAITQPTLGAPALTLGWPASGHAPAHYPVTPSNSRLGTRVATGGPPRWIDTIRAVLASTPQSRALGAAASPATNPPIGPLQGRANVVNPLFGRKGFTYVNQKPAPRLGPNAKLSPGTGRTGKASDRSLGFAPQGYGADQYIDLHQFDYSPPTDPSFDLGTNEGKAFVTIPPSIGVGIDGVDLVGTYRAHDFVMGRLFFKQGRSSGNWQDMTYGPNPRWLLTPQMVQKYNLYSELRLARGPSPNQYFLGYQTQAGVASQLAGAVGQGAPLGYGSH